jgi:hypothetical protein
VPEPATDAMLFRNPKLSQTHHDTLGLRMTNQGDSVLNSKKSSMVFIVTPFS